MCECSFYLHILFVYDQIKLQLFKNCLSLFHEFNVSVCMTTYTNLQDTENDHWFAQSISLAYDESTLPNAYNATNGNKNSFKFDM